MDILKAKSQENGGESLAQHTVDVTTQMMSLVSRSHTVKRLSHIPEFADVMFWAAILHDLGKAAQFFQNVLEKKPIEVYYRHEVLSLAFLDWVEFPSPEFKNLVAFAVATHHKDVHKLRDEYRAEFVDSDSQEVTLDMDLPELEKEFSPDVLQRIAHWLSHKPEELLAQHPEWQAQGVKPKTITPRVQSFYQEARPTIAYHLALLYNAFDDLVQKEDRSGQEFTGEAHERFLHKLLVLRGLMTQADRLASAGSKVDEIPQYTIPDLEQLTSGHTPREHQNIANTVQGHLLLRSPTGSGKTEAALAWAHQQQKLNPEARIWYVLPYQASMNAMQKRFMDKYLPKDLPKDFPKEKREAYVALLHSKAVQVLYNIAQSYTNHPTLPVETDSAEQDKTPNSSKDNAKTATLQNSFNRLFRAPVNIVTPYQLLKVAFQLPSYDILLSNLAGGLLILDEIHAYEPKRLGMFLRFVQYLIEKWDVKVCAMTATLPEWLEKKLEDILGTQLQEPQNPQFFKDYERHTLHVLNKTILDESIITEAVAQTQQGKHVLMICNTIGVAQELYQKVSPMLSEEQCMLLHSRFCSRDRSEKEHALAKKLNPETKDTTGSLSICTQVVEVSLDISADVMYSEIAPLEALLQRFGRVNRRIGNGVAPVYVLAPEYSDQNEGEFVLQSSITPKKSKDNKDKNTEEKPKTSVYDIDLIEAVQKELTKHSGETLNDQEVLKWLREIYNQEVEDFRTGEKTTLAEKYIEQMQEGEDMVSRAINSLTPFNADKEKQEVFERLFDGAEVLPEALLNEYNQLIESKQYLEAKTLFVPVRWYWLRSNDCRREEYPTRNEKFKIITHVLNRNYDKTNGLDLSRKT